jgi:glutathione synthase/RimK-type ligase-like ATP-grasp enzyme
MILSAKISEIHVKDSLHMTRHKIAIATSSQYFPWTFDDQHFIDLGKDHGFQIDPIIWDQEEVKKLKEYDLILVRSIWDYHKKFEHFQTWLDQLQNQQIPLLNSVPVIRWNSLKSYLFKLEKEGIPIIPTWLIKDDYFDTRLFNQKQHPFQDRIILKPLISAGSDLTFLVPLENQDEIREKIRVVQKRSPVLIQPFCESIQTQGEFSLIFFKSQKTIEFSHAVLKKPVQAEFRVQTDFGGSTEAIDPPSQLIEIGLKALEQVKHPWLYARADFVFRENQPCLGELEMIEPLLYFQFSPSAPERFLNHVKNVL